MKRNIIYVFSVVYIGLVLSFSCQTVRPNNDPIIIKDIPICDVSDDMSLQQYLHNTAEFQIEITKYVKDLIAQVKLRCVNIDIRVKK